MILRGRFVSKDVQNFIVQKCSLTVKGWQKFKQLSETRINHCKFQMSIFRKKLHEYTCATFRVLKGCKYYGKNYKPIFTPVPWWS